MFAVPKHIAQLMLVKNNYILQKTFINFGRRQPKTDRTKNSKIEEKPEKLHRFVSKTLTSYLFNLPLKHFQQLHHYKHLREYKSGMGTLTIRNGLWTLLVYPVLKDQKHEKCVKTSSERNIGGKVLKIQIIE